MILDYDYWYFKSAISPDVCDAIVAQGQAKMKKQEELFGEAVSVATTGGWQHKGSDGKEQGAVNDKTIEELKNQGVDPNSQYVRDSHITWLDDEPLFDMVQTFVKEANTQAGWNFDWDYTEEFQFTKYGPGQFYGWHVDMGSKPYRQFDETTDKWKLNPDGSSLLDTFGNPMTEDNLATTNPSLFGKVRKLSVTISLNRPEEYEGGNLKFDFGPHADERFHECKEIRPQGSVVVFPSHIYHQVTPVTQGTRYSLVAWNLGYPFR